MAQFPIKRTLTLIPVNLNLEKYDVNENPKEVEMNEIVAAIRAGDRLKAISLYISSTNKGLTEAQQFVNTLKEKLNAEEEER